MKRRRCGIGGLFSNPMEVEDMEWVKQGHLLLDSGFILLGCSDSVDRFLDY